MKPSRSLDIFWVLTDSIVAHAWNENVALSPMLSNGIG